LSSVIDGLSTALVCGGCGLQNNCMSDANNKNKEELK